MTCGEICRDVLSFAMINKSFFHFVSSFLLFLGEAIFLPFSPFLPVAGKFFYPFGFNLLLMIFFAAFSLIYFSLFLYFIFQLLYRTWGAEIIKFYFKSHMFPFIYLTEFIII